MEQIVAEVAVAGGTSFAIATATSANDLLTALITFGVSLVTMVGGELIKFLVSYLKKKTNDINKEETEDAKKK